MTNTLTAHESLIQRASTIIVVTANVGRNLYQASFAKHVDLLCSMLRMQGHRKSVILIAVSSPYDFVLDKTIATYICTYDFTESAMQALVRVLWGDVDASGRLPGSLQRTKKVPKTRRTWIVEEYDRQRDGPHLKRLLSSLSQTSSSSLKLLASATTGTFELVDTRMDESHFVVRNSSTNLLYGFSATYSVNGTGILAAIFVDPAKRNHSIGRSLYRRAMLHLKNQADVSTIQVGSSLPSLFPGIPVRDEGTRDWLACMGWTSQTSKKLSNLVLGELDHWNMPGDALSKIRQAGLTFDLVQGSGHPESNRVISLVQQHASPEVAELYSLAMRGYSACGIVRVKGADGAILGATVVCAPRSPMTTFIPMLNSGEEDVGGILSPLACQKSNESLVMQALVLMGLRQNKAHEARRAVLTSVSECVVGNGD